MTEHLPSDVLSRLRKQAEIPLVCPISRKELLALIEGAEALRGLSSMYAQTWDRVDGALILLPSGVDRFEKAHADASNALATLEAL